MNSDPLKNVTNRVDPEILSYFLEESRELLAELTTLGGALRRVGFPTPEEAEQLSEFAQKLNRLIGGTAAVGLGFFAPLSRKTARLAEKCAEIKELSIRILIVNLNTVVSTLRNCFEDTQTLNEVESSLPDIEKRIDMCLAAVDEKPPEVKSQSEIDDILAGFDL